MVLEREAKIETPVDTGILRNSYRQEVNGLQGRLINYREYGIRVHEGTGIYARNGNGRKTPWMYQDINGNWRKTVGQKANPWMDRAVDNSEEKIERVFSKEIDLLLETL